MNAVTLSYSGRAKKGNGAGHQKAVRKKPNEINLIFYLDMFYTFFVVGVIHHNVNSAKHLYTQTLSSM